MIENAYKIRNDVRRVGARKYTGEYEVACTSAYVLQGAAVVKCLAGRWTAEPLCVKREQSACSLEVLTTPAINVKIVSSNLVYNEDSTGNQISNLLICHYSNRDSYFNPSLNTDHYQFRFDCWLECRLRVRRGHFP